jgi:undecaprenyl diphosphate synthase
MGRRRIERDKLPRHIAIIMDGNGRWARERGMPRIAGHKAGVKAVREVVSACGELGIEFLTLYTFSSENWKRPQSEVQALMGYLEEYMVREREKLDRNNVRLKVIGRLEGLPERVRERIRETEDLLKDNDGLTLVLAINYGGRWEIVDAVRRISEDVINGRLDPEGIDEGLFSRYLYDPEIPDPDLLIRTGGEMRVSNFLLWQIAYTELYITNVYWPDFRKRHLIEAILDYQRRERRFGGVRWEGSSL